MPPPTPLPANQGLQSATKGSRHWWLQRLTAIALVPLSLYFAFAVAMLGNAGYDTVLAWLQSPLIVMFLIFFIAITFYHAQLGLQVIVDDYIRGWARTALLVLINILCIIFAIAGIVALLTILL